MKPETQNRRLEPTGLAKRGETCGLTGTGPGLASQESADRVFGRLWTRTDRFLWSKPGPLPGYPDPLLTLFTVRLIFPCKDWKLNKTYNHPISGALLSTVIKNMHECGREAENIYCPNLHEQPLITTVILSNDTGADEEAVYCRREG